MSSSYAAMVLSGMESGGPHTHQHDPKFGRNLSLSTKLQEHLVVPFLEGNLQWGNSMPLKISTDSTDTIQRSQVFVLQTSPADHFVTERMCPAIVVHLFFCIGAKEPYANVSWCAFFGIPLCIEFETSSGCSGRRVGDLADLLCQIQDPGGTKRLRR